MVHPALDRLAFLLEPDGVRLHWMTLGTQDPSGLPADNVADEPAESPRAGEAPPQAGRVERDARLAVNGDRITPQPQRRDDLRARAGAGEQPASSACTTTRSGPRCRSATSSCGADGPRRSRPRRGPTWRPCVPPSRSAEADRRARHAMIGENFFSLEADEVLARARERESRGSVSPALRLGPAEPRSSRIPAPRRCTRRAIPPRHCSPGPVSGRMRSRSKPASRVESGGEVRAPALELVATAAALGRPRLDELAERVEKAPAADDVDRRGQLALMALIAMARGEDDKAAASLEQLKPLLEKRAGRSARRASWPELTVTARAIERPRLRPAALALLDMMVDQAQKKSPRMALGAPGEERPARARVLDQLGPGRPSVRHGPRVRPLGAGHARAGRHPRHRRADPAVDPPRRQFTHHPGHATDMMYLRVPLRGEFQLDCELTTFNWREMRVTYAGMTIGPKYDLKHLQALALQPRAARDRAQSAPGAAGRLVQVPARGEARDR